MGFKEIAIIFGIAVIFSTFVLVTIEAFYERPEYQQFCNASAVIPMGIKAALDKNCTYNSTNETQCYEEGGMPVFGYDENSCTIVVRCDMCQSAFTEAQKRYNNIQFYILAAVGAAAIIFGMYYTIEFIGTGFLFSGIFLLLFGTTQNFNELGRYVRPVVLLLELALLLFVAFKKIVKK